MHSEDHDPFADIEAALSGRSDDVVASPRTRVDPGRKRRAGVPEVVLADSKDDATLTESCRLLLEWLPRVIVSRVDVDRMSRIADSLGDVQIERLFPGRAAVVARQGSAPPRERGFVAILTAGSSDLPIAGEAATVAREMGCRVEVVSDVGVAGLHRLVRPLRRVMSEGADVIIVAAGMDGALPSVVAGLVDVPVIALPTSVGYGVAAGGQAALMSMLSSCAPGVVVVNIDNGIGAGATAALIARRACHSGN